MKRRPTPNPRIRVPVDTPLRRRFFGELARRGVIRFRYDRSTFLEQLGAALAAGRWRAGLSQPQAAPLAGIAPSTYASIERGHMETSGLPYLNQIARAVGLRVMLEFKPAPRRRGRPARREPPLKARLHNPRWEALHAKVLAGKTVHILYDDDTFRDQLGAVIVAARRRFNLAQAEVAKRARSGGNVISRVERGHKPLPNLPLMERIARARWMRMGIGFRQGGLAPSH